MKILHCCLAAFYIDGFGYQENLLPKHHKILGHEVRILASTETFGSDHRLTYLKPSSYTNENGIPVTRIPYLRYLPHFLARKIRCYEGVEEYLEDFLPEVIFLHDLQFVSIKTIADYVRRNPTVILYVDGHTDYYNSARNVFSKYILHKIVYRWCAQLIEPFVTKFYGVTPLRCRFFQDVYGIPKSKIDLLVLGIDDSLVDVTKRDAIRETVRSELGIIASDFVVISGGKIDERKNIHVLMQVVKDLPFANLHLVVFGTMTADFRETIKCLPSSSRIHEVGWASPDRINQLLLSADLACFPGTHSVLWEQVVGLGVPCIFRNWEGMDHVDLGGNCIMLQRGDSSEIAEAVTSLLQNRERFREMQSCARKKGPEKFSYSSIARKAIS